MTSTTETPVPLDDGEPVAAAMAYATLALMQQVRPDVLDVLTGPPETAYFWPAGWTWEPEDTPQGNLQKARHLLDTELAEPGRTASFLSGYPSQGEVAAWAQADPSSMPLRERTLDLLRQVGELRNNIVARDEGRISNFELFSERIRRGLADIFLELLDVADIVGFDLETAVHLRWHELTTPEEPK